MVAVALLYRMQVFYAMAQDTETATVSTFKKAVTAAALGLRECDTAAWCTPTLLFLWVILSPLLPSALRSQMFILRPQLAIAMPLRQFI